MGSLRVRMFLSTIPVFAFTVACGAANDTTENPPAATTQSLCDAQFKELFPAGVTGDQPYDFVVRGYEEAWMASRSEGFRTRELHSIGDRCAKASTRSACETTLATMRVLPREHDACVASYPAPGGQAGCGTHYVRWTRGDEVGQAITRDEIRGLMGKIDTVEEAKYLLETDPAGYRPSCESPIGYEVRAEADRYVFRFMNDCEKNGVVHNVVVRRDGTIEVNPTETDTRKWICSMPSGGG